MDRKAHGQRLKGMLDGALSQIKSARVRAGLVAPSTREPVNPETETKTKENDE